MADIASLVIKVDSSDLKQGEAALGRFEKQSGRTEKATDTLGGSLRDLMLIAGGTATVVKAISHFGNLERGLIAVQKTTDFTAKEMDLFEKEISKISRTVPIATQELLGIGSTAGQLGVKGVKNISKFTETLGKLQLATDVVGQEGAAQIARLLNVTGDGIETVDAFGSVLVALGNNSAATESEILRLGTEVAMATSTFSVSSTEAIALGAAMRSMGVRAELGGSVTGRAMRSIEAAIEAGGKEMEHLSKVTGIAADDLKEQFGENATEVFRRWLKGVGGLIKGGQSAASVLDEFGLKGEEVMKVLPTMAVNIDQVERALNLQNEELRKGTALDREAEKASEALLAQWDLLKNMVGEISYDIMEELAPAMKQAIGDFSDWYDANDELIKQNIVTYIGGVADKLQLLVANTDKIVKVFGFLEDAFPAYSTMSDVLGNVFDGLFKIVEISEEYTSKGNRLWESLTGTEEQKNFLEGFNTTLVNIGETVDSNTSGYAAFGRMISEQNEEIGESISTVEEKYKKELGASAVQLKEFFEGIGEKRVKTTEEVLAEIEKKEEEQEKRRQKEREEAEKDLRTSLHYRAKMISMFGDETTDMWEIQARDKLKIEEDMLARIDQANDDFFADLDQKSKDHYDKRLETIGQFTDAAGDAFGEFFGSALKGEFDSVGDAWDGLWNSMLDTLGDVAGKMTAKYLESGISRLFDWGLTKFHDGLWSMEDDEFPAVLQRGEMVIPQGPAERIRQHMMGFEGNYESLADRTSFDPAALGVNREDDLGISVKDHAIDFAAEALGDILGGLISGRGVDLGKTLGSGFTGAVTGMLGAVTEGIATAQLNASRFMGTVDAYSSAGQMFGAGLNVAALGGSPIGGITHGLAKALGGLMGGLLGDLMDDRSFEGLRDALEDGRLQPMEAHAFAKEAMRVGQEDATGGSKLQGIFDAIEGFFGSIADAFGFGEESNFGFDDSYGLQEGEGLGQEGSGIGSGVGGERGTGDEGTSSPGGVGGYATGGVVNRLMVPQGEDGFAALKFGEGVVDVDTMQVLSQQIKSGGLGNAEVVSLLKELIQIVNSGNYAIARNTMRYAKLAQRWEEIGLKQRT